MSFCLIGGTVLTPWRVIKPGVVVVEGGSIAAVGDERVRRKGLPELEVEGLFVAPGFIDIHLHGGGGHDVMEATPEALMAISKAHAQGGTTAWLGTTLTAPMEQIEMALSAIEEATDRPLGGACLLGAHLEGPYFNPEQAGAQNPAYLRSPDIKEFRKLLTRFSCIKRVSLAPELPRALELASLASSRKVLVSIGHSNATYTQVLRAIEAGFSHVTHIYSGMSMVHRRKAYRFAGVLEATLLIDGLTTEMIVDGHHLPPSLMRLVIKAKGTDRVCAITDAISAAGLGPGKYTLGGLEVVVEADVPEGYEVRLEEGSYVAKLADRSAFAGSVVTMNLVVRNLVKLVGLPLTEAVKMATWTPAWILGISHERGMIAPGMKADLVVFDEELDVKMTIVEGTVVYEKR